jgi:hypothetical protein
VNKALNAEVMAMDLTVKVHLIVQPTQIDKELVGTQREVQKDQEVLVRTSVDTMSQYTVWHLVSQNIEDLHVLQNVTVNQAFVLVVVAEVHHLALVIDVLQLVEAAEVTEDLEEGLLLLRRNYRREVRYNREPPCPRGCVGFVLFRSSIL